MIAKKVETKMLCTNGFRDIHWAFMRFILSTRDGNESYRIPSYFVNAEVVMND